MIDMKAQGLAAEEGPANRGGRSIPLWALSSVLSATILVAPQVPGVRGAFPDVLRQASDKVNGFVVSAVFGQDLAPFIADDR